jgi:hypothetical protein
MAMRIIVMRQIFHFFTKNNHRYAARLFTLLAFIYFCLIPDIYALQIEFPPVAERHTTSGIAQISNSYKRSTLKVGDQFFSCAYMAGTRPDCFSHKEADIVRGQHIVVEWFYAQVFPFSTEQKVIRIWGEDGLLISEKDSRRSLKIAKDGTPWLLTFAFLLFLGIGLFYEWTTRIKKKEPENTAEQ